MKKKYIIFPRFHLKHLVLLSYFVLSYIKKLVQEHFGKQHLIAMEFLKLYMHDTGDFLSIIPYIIMKKRSKTEPEMRQTESSLMSDSKKVIFINGDVKKIGACTLFKNFLFLTLVDFIAQIAIVIYYIVKEQEKIIVKLVNLNSTFIFSIISIILFSRIILHFHFFLFF